jgi:hypothetical protein
MLHDKIKKIVKKVIPKEIKPYVPAVAGMFLGPMAGTALSGFISNPMLAQGLGRGLVDIGAQALTSDRISPASALLSGGLGALSGYKGLPELKQGQIPRFAGNPSKFKIGLDKALKQGAKLGRVGNLGDDFNLLDTAKMANIGGTLKSADDALAEQKEKALQRAKDNAAFREMDNRERRKSIIDSMLLAGFTKEEAEKAAEEEGYAFGGRVGLQRGGGANEEAMAEMMMNMESDEFYVDEEGNLRRIPKKRPRQNTRAGMNEEMMFDLMRRMDLNRLGRAEGGPADQQGILGLGPVTGQIGFPQLPGLQPIFRAQPIQEPGIVGQIMSNVKSSLDNASSQIRENIRGSFKTQETLVPAEGEQLRPTTFRPFLGGRPNFARLQELASLTTATGMKEGGSMQMAMSDPDPMAERSDMLENLSLKYFGKPLSRLSDEEVIELQDLMDDMPLKLNKGGKVPGLPPGRQVDAREGTFIPMGGAKRADDVPAMLSVNEFVLNDDAVAGLGKLMTGNPDPRAGARALYKIQDQLEAMA